MPFGLFLPVHSTVCRSILEIRIHGVRGKAEDENAKKWRRAMPEAMKKYKAERVKEAKADLEEAEADLEKAQADLKKAQGDIWWAKDKLGRGQGQDGGDHEIKRLAIDPKFGRVNQQCDFQVATHTKRQ